MNALTTSLFFALTTAGLAQQPKPQVDFNRDVKPLFAKYCYECHSVGKKEKAGFVFDKPERLIKSMGQGQIIVPGKVQESDLIAIVQGAQGKKKMPPDESLSPQEVQVLSTWIKEGASLPGLDVAAKVKAEKRERPKQFMNWTSAEGRSIKATFEGMEADTVLLKVEDGTVYRVPLQKLNLAGQFQARQLAAD
jgi:hypothetical protein